MLLSTESPLLLHLCSACVRALIVEENSDKLQYLQTLVTTLKNGIFAADLET
jgi:hypothetical protein